jgi:NitT/TauT family transport system permease protein
MRRARRAFFAALGLLALLLLWQLAFELGGPFIMPRPADAFARAFDLVRSDVAWRPALITTKHVLIGFGLGGLLGFALGLVGGAFEDLGAALRSISTVTLGVPPIIWIVLALFWFGPQGMAPAFVVAVGTAPIVFAGAFSGMRSLAPELDELAAAFNAPRRQRFLEIRVPQMSVAVVPSLATALGLAWKMALMAEVIDAGDGIGGAIANARAQLDTTDTMAWVIIALFLLLATDLLLAKAARTATPNATRNVTLDA